MTFLDFADYGNLAYITSVFIGYIGTDSIGSLIKRFAAKKAGVEDGRNHNQRAPICWRGRSGLITGRQKTRTRLWRHCRRRAIYWLLRSYPATCRLFKPKLKSTGAGRYQLLSRWWMPTASSLAWKTSLRKSGRCGIGRLRSVALTYDLSWWYPSGNRPLQQYLGFTAGRWLCQFEHKADSLIAKFKEAAERSERLMYEQSHRDYLRLVICIIVCLSWAVNHYRDNA